MKGLWLSTTLVWIGAVLGSIPHAQARDLTFEDRVKAQEAIERVYYSHQIGTTRLFEEAAPRFLLEQKVRAYLKQSAALEKFWNTAVTADMLQQEMVRMVRQTRMPERLRELYAVLGDDPFLIQECLARPVLVDRLSRNFFAYDATLHAKTRQGAESLRDDLAQGRLDPRAEVPGRTVVQLIRVDAVEGVRAAVERDRSSAARWGDPSRLELQPDAFNGYRDRLPARVGEIAQVQEERETFVIRVVLNRTEDEIKVASFAVPKLSWDAWWNSVAGGLNEASVDAVAAANHSLPLPRSEGSGVISDAGCPADDTWDNGSLDDLPGPRTHHTAVWTGSLMVIWGGYDGSFLNTGARYDPATDTWTPVSTTNAPSGRGEHTAVWTGSRMVVWGGGSGSSGLTNTGGRYDPTTDTWTPTSTANAPSARSGHTAVWTGSRMVVWGGNDGETVNTGARYDPATDTWTPTSMANAPSGRYQHSAVWTDSLMVVWGGFGGPYLNTGGRYDPATDTWTPMSTTNAPSARDGHTAVWTGGLMLVWGGEYPLVNTGARYDPATDTWTPMSTTNAPSARYRHTAVWTGSLMVVSGGSNLSTGGRYDPTTDTWTPTSTANAPSARSGHTAVWTGRLMVVWGGFGGSGPTNTGGRYDPATDTWTPTSTANAPSARNGHSAVWTGSLMVVWGGYDGSSYILTGGRYDPATDNWTATSTTSAPSVRYQQTVVWTGSLMVVWGGGLDTGGRYDPIADTWTPTSTANAPSARSAHTAVWTGSLMIVWGGLYPYLNTGARYDPATDTWTPMSTTNAPSARYDHTAVWTGSLMVVWGGYDGSSLNTGARYDPATDTWSPTSTINAPSDRSQHAAVWTGSLMVVWGGYGSLGFDDIGGRYDPATDTWTPTSTINAPSPRTRFTAIWTGSRMVVWGGSTCCFVLRTGGRYDPATDTWTPTSTANSPSARHSHTAVWTGNLMIVWGGYDGSFFLNTGGRYVIAPVVDGDGDGFSECQGDCDDTNPVVHPGVAESCDGIDNNCDGRIDEGFDVGSNCAVDLDECHQVVGTRQCRPDGKGTQCSGDAIPHDTTPPMISCPSEVTLECPTTSGSIGLPVVTDACDPKPQFVSDAPFALPLGARVVTWLATDASGNHSTCQETIVVVDTTPPQLRLTLSSTVLWPPNHRMVPVQAAWQASDACDPGPGVLLVSATSSEPDDAPGNGDGSTTGDIQDDSVATPDTTVLLRAERSADGPGRVYTLTYAARDASGNTASALGVVMVPHDVGTGPEPVMLNVERDGTPGMAHLNWNAVSGAEMYDVIQGDLSQVSVSDGKIWLGPVLVLASGQTEASYSEGPSGAIPAAGSAFFYLVQYREGQSASGWGTESSPWPAEPSSCDTGCPGEPVAPAVASMTLKRK